ncbi:MAG: RagB/SusD family nutrient uptake outer membrane protein [Niabella sp.]
MKKQFIYIIFSLVTLTFVSCSKWLEVQPEDKITEDQVYSSPQNIYDALNSIYVNIGKPALYGQDLTMTFVEILAQQYNVATSHIFYPFAQYNYADKKVLDTTESIWTNAYSNIAGANNFIETLGKYPGVIPQKQEDILIGEAIALRAFLHFDLLRLFGPIYNSADSTKPSIPYYRKISSNYNPYLPANAVIDSILQDISTAQAYLSNDPVITNGSAGDEADNTFFQNRNYRMNYYALKALEARVQLYRGNKAAALDAAKFVINNAQDKFPWITSNKILSEKNSPDRVFSTELLFGAMYTSLYNVQQNIYDQNLQDANILAPLDGRLKAVYEDPTYPNDFRYTPMWIAPNVTSKTYKTFYKYADVADVKKSFRFTIPLIRISEMYYIVAECEPDAATAVGYLNTVRFNRGIPDLAATVNVTTEIRKEYMKEFYGEGQLFYYYKRTKAATIPNGAAATGNIAMNATKYVVPVPQSETNFH